MCMEHSTNNHLFIQKKKQIIILLLDGKICIVLHLDCFVTSLQIGRSYVISKLKKYPKFQAVAIATQRSGFKVDSM